MSEVGFNTAIHNYLDKLVKLAEDGNQEEAMMLAEIIKNIGKEFSEERDTYLKEIAMLREENIELESKLSEIYKRFDEIQNKLPHTEYESFAGVCAERYGIIWVMLEDKSRKYIVTAHYLMNYLRGNLGDCAPVVLELCRSLENELREKIFIEFIDQISVMPVQNCEYDSDYTDLGKAINQNRRSGYYFLSLNSMITELSNSNSLVNTSNSSTHLRKYLTQNGWNIEMLADTQFIRDMRKYVKNYRNVAAHPNQAMNSETASSCSKQTFSIISRFVKTKER